MSTQRRHCFVCDEFREITTSLPKVYNEAVQWLAIFGKRPPPGVYSLTYLFLCDRHFPTGALTTGKRRSKHLLPLSPSVNVPANSSNPGPSKKASSYAENVSDPIGFDQSQFSSPISKLNPLFMSLYPDQPSSSSAPLNFDPAFISLYSDWPPQNDSSQAVFSITSNSSADYVPVHEDQLPSHQPEVNYDESVEGETSEEEAVGEKDGLPESEKVCL